MSRFRVCLLLLGLGAGPTLLVGGACDSLGTPDCTPGLTAVNGSCVRVGSNDGGPNDGGSDAATFDGGSDASAGGPAFGGVTSVSPADAHSLLVTWSPAVDPTTQPSQMTYLVYVAQKSGGEVFDIEHAVQVNGQTSTVITTFNGAELTQQEYFVVVGARNNAGVETLNRTIELGNTPRTDTTPPTFTSAITAVPLTECQAQLSWTAASGKYTTAAGIHYAIYDADPDAGTQATPWATTAYGATSFVVPGIDAVTPFHSYRVVAIDSLGNPSTSQPIGNANAGTVSFSASVQPVLSSSCAPGCHTLNTTDKLSPIYDVGYAFEALLGPGDVGVKAAVCSPYSPHFCTLDAGDCAAWQGDAGPVDLVTPGDPGCSVLFEVLNQKYMPPMGAQPIDACDTALIQRWIAQGAHP